MNPIIVIFIIITYSLIASLPRCCRPSPLTMLLDAVSMETDIKDVARLCRLYTITRTENV